MSYPAKDELVRARQLKTQRLVLPFSILGHATPASVTVTVSDPAILFIRTEGVDQITTTTGALASADTAPTYTAPSDANGRFAVLVKIGESVNKVLSAKFVKKNGNEVFCGTLTSTPSTGIVAGGNTDKICLNADTATDFSGANTWNGCLELDYEVSE